MRIILSLLFSVNDIVGYSTNLLSIIIAVTLILAYTSSMGGVYNLWLLNLLEQCFLLNLILLSAMTLYMYAISVDNRTIVTQLSVGFAFLVFIIIILYHITDNLITARWKKNLQKMFTLQVQERDKVVKQSIQSLHSVKLCEPLLSVSHM